MAPTATAIGGEYQCTLPLTRCEPTLSSYAVFVRALARCERGLPAGTYDFVGGWPHLASTVARTAISTRDEVAAGSCAQPVNSCGASGVDAPPHTPRPPVGKARAPAAGPAQRVHSCAPAFRQNGAASSTASAPHTLHRSGTHAPASTAARASDRVALTKGCTRSITASARRMLRGTWPSPLPPGLYTPEVEPRVEVGGFFASDVSTSTVSARTCEQRARRQRIAPNCAAELRGGTWPDV